LIERMLTEVFGMEWYKVHDEAERLEHAVSEDFEKLLVSKLGVSGSCPHGNRTEIDTIGQRRQRGWTPLDEVNAPAAVSVVSVYERDRQLLEFLNGMKIRPGAKLDIVSRNYDGTLTLKVGSQSSQLGLAVARKIWVEPAA
jgi:DtxR family Mn-dependent transcriptional regulator